MLGVAYVLLRKDDSATIAFKKVDVIEYGDTSINSKDFVKKVTGEIISYPEINVMKIGEQELIYKAKSGSTTNEISFTIRIKDTKLPKITLKQKEITIILGTDFDPNSIVASVVDEVDGALVYKNKKAKNAYRIMSKVDVTKEGSYPVKVMAIDKNGNTTNATCQVHVSKEGNPIETPPINTELQPTYIKGVLIVNKTYGLPRDFGATDPDAYAALQQLQAAALQAGYNIPTLSGYRPYDTQVRLYNDYVARDGKEAADRYSARPGYSEHQSGLCFDIGSIDNDYGSTPEGKWLQENCASYGYIIRYPNGKEAITGYMYEPWHVRYVGVDIAQEIMKKGSTLEEYLGV